MRRWIAIALAAGLLIGAIRWWPASALSAALPSTVNCALWQGSVWRGRCAALLIDQQPMGTVDWTLSVALRPLPGLRLAFLWRTENSFLRATLLPGRTLTLVDVTVDCALHELRPWTTLALAGTIGGTFEKLVWREGELLHARGALNTQALRLLTWRGIAVPELELGDFQLSLDTRKDSRPRAWLQETAGPLRLRAEIDFPPGRRLHLQGELAPSSESSVAAARSRALLLPAIAAALGGDAAISADGTLALRFQTQW